MKFKIMFLTLILLTVLTISSVNATDNNVTVDEIGIENYDSIEKINIDDDSSDENEELLAISSSNEGNYCKMSNSYDEDILCGTEGHSYKITVKPAKVYSNKKFTYTAKLTDNGKPVSGVYLDLSINDASNGWTSYGARTNSNGIATFKLDSEYSGKYEISVEIDDVEIDGWAYASSYIKVVTNPKAKTTVKAPKITAKYKTNKYFKIALKNYKGKPIKNLKLTLDIKTGKKWKSYHVKTNKKGIAKFNVKKLKSGTHEVIIYDENADSKYDIYKVSKIIIKKTTTKKKSSYITFKSPSGYKWKIKTSTWKKMKKQATKNYNFFKSVGSSHPGYSDKSVNVKVTKNGHTYKGTAYAVKNSRYMRCEIRGAVRGVYISNKGDSYV